MSLFFESIRLINGRVMNLSHHQIRINRAMSASTTKQSINLQKHFKNLELPKVGLFKLRVSYDALSGIVGETSINEYHEKAIHSLKLVKCNFNYEHKSEDRESLNRAFAQRGKADDILLVKNGLVTDTWYCNVAFFDGTTWFTPKNPLLQGTMRAKLVATKKIIPATIRVKDLSSFRKVRLFNAMIPWSQRKEIVINRIQ